VRDNRGKAKQVTTFNGRTVIIKENSVYSNKGGHKRIIRDIMGCIVLADGQFIFRLQVPYPSPTSLGCTVLYFVKRVQAMAHLLHFAPTGRVVRSRQNHSGRSTRDYREEDKTDPFR
jgi:hypothetical protein